VQIEHFPEKPALANAGATPLLRQENATIKEALAAGAAIVAPRKQCPGMRLPASAQHLIAIAPAPGLL
jgi:hypothetical protein